MIDAILDGICIAVSEEFGDDYEIYTENIKQGLREPCFSVLCLNPSIRQVLGKRYFRTHQFCVHYFPLSKNEAKAECHDVIERLYDCLELITADGDLIRGTEMSAEFVDNVVSFFVNYDLYVYKETEAVDEMEELEHSTDVTEG